MHLPTLLKYGDTGKDAEPLDTGIHSWPGCKMGAVTLENHLAVSYKAKHATAIPLSNCTPEHWAREMKSVFTQKFVHKCSSQLYSSYSKTVNNQMSFDGWMVKQVVIHPCHGTPLGNKHNFCYKQQLGCIARELCRAIKPIPRGYILSNSIYGTFWNAKF